MLRSYKIEKRRFLGVTGMKKIQQPIITSSESFHILTAKLTNDSKKSDL